jgi:hypothetical protein
MKKLLILCLIVLSLPVNAQESLSMRKLFLQMPDTLLGYLTHSNCLDMADYLDANMKAEVTNALDGKSELLVLTDDSLSLRMNESHHVIGIVLDTKQEIDSCYQVIAFCHTLFLTTGQKEQFVRYYTRHWQLCQQEPSLTAISRRRIAGMTRSTLLRRDDDVFAKEPVSAF